MAREAVIVESVRTGLTKANRGSFNITEPVDYLAHALRSVVERVPNLDAAEIEGVFERADHRLLADQARKIGGPILARQHAIGSARRRHGRRRSGQVHAQHRLFAALGISLAHHP